jgi:hypothetical protein
MIARVIVCPLVGNDRAVVPKPKASAWVKIFHKFHRQRLLTGVGDVPAKLLTVRRKDADAPPPARNCHILLLRVRRRLDGRIGKRTLSNAFLFGFLDGDFQNDRLAFLYQ